MARDANLAVDLDRIVLNRAHTRHLHTGLQRASQEQAAEGTLVFEQGQIRRGLLLTLAGEGVLDLEKLGAHPGIVLVAVRVEAGKRGEALVFFAVGDEPARGFGKEGDEQGEDTGGDDLDAEGDLPLFGIVIFEADERA